MSPLIQAEIERRKSYKLTYLGVQMLAESGLSADVIRERVLGESTGGSASAVESTVSEMVALAVDDALAGRPPRYFRDSDFKPANCAAQFAADDLDDLADDLADDLDD